MTKDEALKLALSALDEVRQETFRLMRDGQTLYAEKKVWEAIYTIKKVLAQPKQEPVGIFAKFTDGIWREVADGSNGIPLYAKEKT
jgi:hypothetical protein